MSNAAAKKRKSLTTREKIDIISELECGTKNATVCKIYNLTSSTVSTIWKNREEILSALENNQISVKKIRKCDLNDVDQALWDWFTMHKNAGFPVNGPILKMQAEIFAKLLGHANFTCSNGWLDRFKARHNIVFSNKMSGIGRGRGWLNINKNTNTNTKPGIPSPVETTINYDFNPTITTVSPPKPNGKYANIISKISLYNENDDGILLNQKLKHLIEEYTKDCNTATEVKEAVNAIYEHCLNNEEFAIKTIGFVSARTFNTIIIHGIKIRNLFVTQFEKDFKERKQLQTSNPKGFRIVVRMLGEFYHKAKLSDGKPLQLFASPMLSYLDMLLESNSEDDLQLFTTMLHLTGNSIRDELPSKLMDLLIQARNVLAYNDKLSTTSRLWLMMAIDISNNRFNFMPNELHQFYLTHLGDNAMSQMKKISTDLSIQTNYHNLTLDWVQSNVNVLQQVSTANDGWDSPTQPRNYRNADSDAGFSNIGTWEQPKNEKTPRPILGAGVRLKQAENKSDDLNWTDRKNDESKDTKNWENKKGGGSGWDNGTNKPKKNVSKGWEHDDRFENDYN